MRVTAEINGEVSYWFSQVATRPARAPLDRDLTVDVALVGAGYTNLWIAYYLKQARPDLEIAILEREVAGFGASSRNGGWISYGLPGQHSRYAKAHGVQAVRDFQRELFATIGEIVDVAAREGIEADIAHEGEVAIARNPAQLARLREEYEGGSQWGFGPGDLVMLDRDGANEHARLSNAVGGLWSPHCARVQPALLASGLADTVERMGVRIYEHTAVSEIVPHTALTERGNRVSAEFVVRGTEGYTNSLKGHSRDWLPKLSSMLVTEPLTPEQHREIGWDTNVMVRDAGHFFSYIHRTADDRIALGGPGVPYLWGSGWDDRGSTLPASEQALVRALHTLFPMLKDHPIAHTWTGILGIPRNWSATVTLDRASGMAVAGGYVGDGVTSTNLAGRTMRDLILGDDTQLTRMPWVGGQIRKWEPEPLRWIALRGMYGVYNLADRLEDRSGSPKTSILARAANVIAGRS
ncbi:NAD(P)/FAD-dependent oxidoreductase [Leucobacter aridicollis]|uniref:NAD(P)/FAD-dependent oxidoreductase n=1 Tax=Leucobacter aridicollis TaxID=283878 RepID=UPI00210637F8|nr:FAD-dependent oxidoreductase [Leucobacter aridicollis]UTX53740.1 FAD-dependent oxidoreductase [Leucobacter aridicollis]